MENKCPHCGKPMPKSSAFCMYCMHAINERETPPVFQKSSKKGSLILCCFLLFFLLCGSISFALTYHRKPKPATTVSQTVSVSETKTEQEVIQSTTKKKKMKEETSTSSPTTQAQVTTQKPTETSTAKAPTTSSNQVLINNGVLSDYPLTKTDSVYSIPYAVTHIVDNAFHGNPYLRTLKFSKRSNLHCNWSNLFASLPNLETIYIYTGTNADTEGMQYFDGEIIYYYD